MMITLPASWATTWWLTKKQRWQLEAAIERGATDWAAKQWCQFARDKRARLAREMARAARDFDGQRQRRLAKRRKDKARDQREASDRRALRWAAKAVARPRTVIRAMRAASAYAKIARNLAQVNYEEGCFDDATACRNQKIKWYQIKSRLLDHLVAIGEAFIVPGAALLADGTVVHAVANGVTYAARRPRMGERAIRLLVQAIANPDF